MKILKSFEYLLFTLNQPNIVALTLNIIKKPKVEGSGLIVYIDEIMK